MDDRYPTWWEGYWARAVGWGFYAGHTEQYIAGWRYRNEMERRG